MTTNEARGWSRDEWRDWLECFCDDAKKGSIAWGPTPEDKQSMADFMLEATTDAASELLLCGFVANHLRRYLGDDGWARSEWGKWDVIFGEGKIDKWNTNATWETVKGVIEAKLVYGSDQAKLSTLRDQLKTRREEAEGKVCIGLVFLVTWPKQKSGNDLILDGVSEHVAACEICHWDKGTLGKRWPFKDGFSYGARLAAFLVREDRLPEPHPLERS